MVIVIIGSLAKTKGEDGDILYDASNASSSCCKCAVFRLEITMKRIQIRYWELDGKIEALLVGICWWVCDDTYSNKDCTDDHQQ